MPTTRLSLLASLLAVLAAGCSTVGPPKEPAAPATAPAPAPAPPAPPATATAPAPSPAEDRAALTAALAREQQWLLSWFKGTPVQISQRRDGALLVDVPREFCFEPGRSGVKPPLAAVLDKVADTLRRRPTAYLSLSAPADEVGSGTTLALDRALQVQRHLRERGVPVKRLGKPGATRVAAVQLRIAAAPQ